MEGGAKNDVNGGAPLPQRPPKNATDSPMDKKPRFMPSVGSKNQSGGGNKGIKDLVNRGGNFRNQQEQDDPMQDQSHQNQPPSNADCGNDDVVMMPPPQMQNSNQSRQNQGGGGGGNRGPGGSNQRRDRSRSSGGGNRASMGGPGDPGDPGRNDDFFIGQRLRDISGPTHELPAIENTEETKFSERNLTNDVTEEELREIFKPFGEIGEVFSNPDKNFALTTFQAGHRYHHSPRTAPLHMALKDAVKK
uniref:RRM domain-containing protein n=1 Tax=Glossina pallidipes TaxID=7398 RepID=A0A1A9ZQS6_GLOPL